ncbi:unnamed protein product [Caenorhabditis nigoni]
MIDRRPDYSPNYLVLFLKTIPIILSAVIVIGFLCFAPFDRNSFVITRFLFGCSSAIFGALKFVKLLLTLKIRTSRKRCKWELPIGLGGISICTIAMRISMFYLERDIENAALLFLLTTGTCYLLYDMFILRYDEYCVYPKRITKLGEQGLDILAAVHLIILLISLRAASFMSTENYWVFVIFAQLFYTITCLASTSYLFLVLTGNIWLDELEDDLISVKAPNYPAQIFDFFPMDPSSAPATPSQPTDALECKICLLPYTTYNRIPKILSKCGHTICENCAKTLEKNRAVICPFCLKPTVVDANNKLPKNYAVLDILDDLNNNN